MVHCSFFNLLPCWMVLVEVHCSVHVALSKMPINSLNYRICFEAVIILNSLVNELQITVNFGLTLFLLTQGRISSLIVYHVTTPSGSFNLQPFFQKGVLQKSDSRNLVREVWVEKSGSRKMVLQTWILFSGSRKMVDQKKRWVYTINPPFFWL